jgi:hypothetical protein
MFQITIRCEKVIHFGSDCAPPIGGGWTTYDLNSPAPDSFPGEFERYGWVERDGKHYCQRHNPDLIGEKVTISRDYVEVAPGVRVRWPGAIQQGDNMQIEVQVEDPGASPETSPPLCHEEFDGSCPSCNQRKWVAMMADAYANLLPGDADPAELFELFDPRRGVVNRDQEG